MDPKSVGKVLADVGENLNDFFERPSAENKEEVVQGYIDRSIELEHVRDVIYATHHIATKDHAASEKVLEDVVTRLASSAKKRETILDLVRRWEEYGNSWMLRSVARAAMYNFPHEVMKHLSSEDSLTAGDFHAQKDALTAHACYAHAREKLSWELGQLRPGWYTPEQQQMLLQVRQKLLAEAVKIQQECPREAYKTFENECEFLHKDVSRLRLTKEADTLLVYDHMRQLAHLLIQDHRKSEERLSVAFDAAAHLWNPRNPVSESDKPLYENARNLLLTHVKYEEWVHNRLKYYGDRDGIIAYGKQLVATAPVNALNIFIDVDYYGKEFGEAVRNTPESHYLGRARMHFMESGCDDQEVGQILREELIKRKGAASDGEFRKDKEGARMYCAQFTASHPDQAYQMARDTGLEEELAKARDALIKNDLPDAIRLFRMQDDKKGFELALNAYALKSEIPLDEVKSVLKPEPVAAV